MDKASCPNSDWRGTFYITAEEDSWIITDSDLVYSNLKDKEYLNI